MEAGPADETLDAVPRRRFLSLLEPLSSQPGSLCCWDSRQRNKVLPGEVRPEDCGFLEICPGRRIRVISVGPGDDGHEVGADGQRRFPQDGGGQSDGGESVISGEEEYWFENAAPNRLPVIQPPPQVQTGSRIINKFEPQVQTQIDGIGKRFEEDLISPGRLPRKTISATAAAADGFDDDYEDEFVVSRNETIMDDLHLVEQVPAVQRNGTTSLALSNVSEMILEITAESSSPRPNRTSPSPRSPSPDGGSPSRSPDPADDSCHPSPEVPHRLVSSSPDPLSHPGHGPPADQPVIVSGGNLGGVANVGFTSDETFGEGEPGDGEDTAAGAVNELIVGKEDIDAGYSRKRNLEDILRQQIDESFNQPDPLGDPDPSSSESRCDDVDPASDNLDTSHAGPSNNLPVLFFLHGVGGSADMWSSQFSYFRSHGYQCVAPDMLGHGFSSCPDKAKAYTFAKLFKDVLHVFDTYVPADRRTVIIGHSYGCSFSVALARARSDRVSTLVLIASGGPTPLAPPPSLSKYPTFVVDCLRHVLECKFKSQQQKYNPRGKVIKFKEAFDVPSYVFRHVMAGQVWPEGDAGFHRRVTVPTLLVYGMRDTLVSLVEECEMERTIPKSYLELVPTAGHHVMLDEPRQLAIMAHKFIEKWNK